MKFSEYQELSKRTMPKQGSNRDHLSNYVMGLAGESGEFIDLLKKSLFHGHYINVDDLGKELGDILHYWVGLCTLLGFSAEEVATANIVKLQKRYPNGFSVKDSIKRVDVE
jgi:NTP pyrophosphatase (non-canonical NTP hydrolase)